jgi:hypothetical protein
VEKRIRYLCFRSIPLSSEPLQKYVCILYRGVLYSNINISDYYIIIISQLKLDDGVTCHFTVEICLPINTTRSFLAIILMTSIMKCIKIVLSVFSELIKSGKTNFYVLIQNYTHNKSRYLVEENVTTSSIDFCL